MMTGIQWNINENNTQKIHTDPTWDAKWNMKTVTNKIESKMKISKQFQEQK